MTEPRPPQITPVHLAKVAVVYGRVSTPRQARDSTGSIEHQRNQQAHALAWGWRADQIRHHEDLGRSGTRADNRTAFQELLKLVSDGRVGAVLVANAARLSRAVQDFEALVALCRFRQTLLVIEGRVLDLNDPASRLMARIEGGVADYENSLRIKNSVDGKYAKARLGHAVSLPPTGYVVTTKGQWAKDADQAVQQAIEQVFRLFRQLGSAPQVLRALARAKAMLPIRTGTGEPRWVRPNISRLHLILKNPAYAGFYAFGQRRAVTGGRRGATRSVPPSEWIMVPHHEGYITPAEWRANQERLQGNRFPATQPVGRGTALCQGLLWCGRCNRRMRVTYYRLRVGREIRIRYACVAAYAEYADPICWVIPGGALDSLVAQELLRHLQPADLAAVFAAGREVNQDYEAAQRRRAHDLADAEYQADLAKRRYEYVVPENRRLVATLEQAYEQALRRLEEVRFHQRQEFLAPPLTLTPEEVSAICRDARDLPGLWSAPTTTPHDQKELLRLFVQRIRLTALSASEFTVEILWVGGEVTAHRIPRPRKAALVAHELRTQGWRPAMIAAELTRRGFRTGTGEPFTNQHVYRLCTYATQRAARGRGKHARAAAAESNAPGQKTACAP